jgi:hypothetical protein
VLCDPGLKHRSVAELRLSLQIKPTAKAHLGKLISFTLGQVKIVKAAALGRIPKLLAGPLVFSRPLWREDAHDKTWKLSGLLEWRQFQSTDGVDVPAYFNVWSDDGADTASDTAGDGAGDGAGAAGFRFVCRVYGYCARVRLSVDPARCKTVRLTVQPVTAADLKPTVADCTSITLRF